MILEGGKEHVGGGIGGGIAPSKPGGGELCEGMVPKNTISIFKAPGPGKGNDQYRNGYNPKDFCTGDQCAYFTKEKNLADEYAKHYGEGVIEIKIPKDTYNSRLRQYEYPYQGGPYTELPIPHSDFDVLNSAERYWYR